MKRTRVLGWVVHLGFLCSLTLASAAPLRLTVGEAVSKALDSNVEVRQAREEWEKNVTSRSHNFRLLFPTVVWKSMAATQADALSYSPLILFDGNNYNLYKSGIEAKLPLLKGAGLWAEQNRQSKNERIAHWKYQKAERDITLKLLEAYYKVLVVQRKVAVYEYMDSLLKDLVNRGVRRQNMGTERKSAVYQFKTRLALNTPKTLKARNELVLAATQLAYYFNDRTILSFEIADPLTVDFLKSLAQRSRDLTASDTRIEVLMSDMEVSRQSDDRSVAMAEHWPTLAAFGNYYRTATRFSDMMDSDAGSWSYGLELTIPLFSGLSSMTQRRMLAHEDVQARLKAAEARNQAALDSARSNEDLALYEKQLVSSQDALKFAREGLKATSLDYSRGLDVYSQVFDAQESLVEAENNMEQTMLDYFMAIARHEVAQGRSLTDWIQQMSEIRR